MQKNTIILGAGITGLSVAHFLAKKNTDFLVIESSNRVGGNIDSQKINGFICENGPNTVLQNNDAIRLLIKDCGLQNSLSNPKKEAENNRFVLKNNKLQRLPSSPFQLLWTPILSWKDKFRMLKELKVSAHDKDTSISQFFNRRFGENFTTEFVVPFITGIYAGNPEKMSAKYALKKVWDIEQKHGSVIKGLMKKEKPKHKAKMLNFPNGLSQLTSTMESQLKDNIQLNSTVTQIKKIKEGYQLKVNDQEIICQKIICTLPAHALSNIIDDAILSNELNNIEYVPNDIFHFGFDKKEVKNQSQGFGVLTKPSDKKSYLGILFNSRIFPQTAPADKELFTVIVGGSRQPELCQLKKQDLEDMVLKEVQELLQCHSKPTFSKQYKYHKGIPQYNLDQEKLIQAIDRFQTENPNFHILGNYTGGISVSDCILKSHDLIKNF